ncbi:MAG TPA: BON domain-containing protein [Thermoleophilia bacterium]|nr:BON domain-containing protein [Thermoleophilia bacterium]
MRSEEKLRRDVEDELEWEPSIDRQQIGVAIKDGVVTLVGETHSLSEKWMAEEAVERVAGVKDVVNEITVSLLREPTDDDLVTAALNVLEWNAQVPRGRVVASVEGGWITLAGELDHDYQRRAAEEAMKSLRGVRGVTNQTTIASWASRSDSARAIESALRRAAMLGLDEITVEISGGTVTLRGTVRSCAERRAAERIAFRCPDVTVVKNLLLLGEPVESRLGPETR